MKIPYIIYRQEDGFVAEAVGDIFLASEGETESEAIKNFKEALELYFESVEPEKQNKIQARFDILDLEIA